MQTGKPMQHCGIGYTGLAQLQGLPTHEWIATRLAECNCQDPGVAARRLRELVPAALLQSGFSIRQEFLIAGWGLLADKKTLVPHMRLITNAVTADKSPGTEFESFELRLGSDNSPEVSAVGTPIPTARVLELRRLLRRLIEREIGPAQATMALVREILATADNVSTVGRKILCYCIPREAAVATITSGNTLLLAQTPDSHTASFCYFDPAYSELRQFGPTFVCGETAVNDVETESDPSRDFQSSSVKYLHLPKRRPN